VPQTPQAPPTPGASRRFTVAIRLISGELVEAGETDDEDKAAALGRAVIDELSQSTDEWPLFAGRYIRPESIVSIDLIPLETS
jgi:hypothetical protein